MCVFLHLFSLEVVVGFPTLKLKSVWQTVKPLEWLVCSREPQFPAQFAKANLIDMVFVHRLLYLSTSVCRRRNGTGFVCERSLLFSGHPCKATAIARATGELVGRWKTALLDNCFSGLFSPGRNGKVIWSALLLLLVLVLMNSRQVLRIHIAAQFWVNKILLNWTKPCSWAKGSVEVRTARQVGLALPVSCFRIPFL